MSATEPAGKFRMSDGDWICSDPQCANLNFARRTVCNRCNKERESSQKKKLGQEIGKAAAEKSKGLFSADDWQCSKCCNVNWARRQSCNMCNAPKFGDVEERTGYGGGYNDRGVVEYVKRDESDDEFDEFGRRKKRRGSSRNGDHSPRSSHRESDDEAGKVNGQDEEEDEDDDEDDGDLSKYDLTEWDDLAAEAAAAKNDKVSDSKDSKNERNDRDRRDSRDREWKDSRDRDRRDSRDRGRRDSRDADRNRHDRNSHNSRRRRSRTRSRSRSPY